jgi:hypothetical protein
LSAHLGTACRVWVLIPCCDSTRRSWRLWVPSNFRLTPPPAPQWAVGRGLDALASTQNWATSLACINWSICEQLALANVGERSVRTCLIPVHRIGGFGLTGLNGSETHSYTFGTRRIVSSASCCIDRPPSWRDVTGDTARQFGRHQTVQCNIARTSLFGSD